MAYRLGGEKDDSVRPQGEVLLPTPVASDCHNPPTPQRSAERALERMIPLSERVLLLRTPTAQLAENGGAQHPDKRKAGGHGPTLADEVEFLLPTPTADRMGDDNLKAWTERSQELVDRGIPVPNWTLGMALNTMMTKSEAQETLLPTPRAQNGESRNQTCWKRPAGQPQNLENVLAHVKASSGGGTSQPSDAGKP